jgi:hypothetical protein
VPASHSDESPLRAFNLREQWGAAFRIAEAGHSSTSRCFALTGIAIYAAFTALSSYLLGRWHEASAPKDEFCRGVSD